MIGFPRGHCAGAPPHTPSVHLSLTVQKRSSSQDPVASRVRALAQSSVAGAGGVALVDAVPPLGRARAGPRSDTCRVWLAASPSCRWRRSFGGLEHVPVCGFRRCPASDLVGSGATTGFCSVQCRAAGVALRAGGPSSQWLRSASLRIGVTCRCGVARAGLVTWIDGGCRRRKRAGADPAGGVAPFTGVASAAVLPRHVAVLAARGRIASCPRRAGVAFSVAAERRTTHHIAGWSTDRCPCSVARLSARACDVRGAAAARGIAESAVQTLSSLQLGRGPPANVPCCRGSLVVQAFPVISGRVC